MSRVGSVPLPPLDTLTDLWTYPRILIFLPSRIPTPTILTQLIWTYLLPRSWTECENITFPQVLLRAVKIEILFSQAKHVTSNFTHNEIWLKQFYKRVSWQYGPTSLVFLYLEFQPLRVENQLIVPVNLLCLFQG